MSKLQEKACKKCRKVKQIDDFYENKYSPDGRYAFCKVCFDQFAQKLTDKVHSSDPLKKTCKKCGKVRLIDAFDENPDNTDSKSDWCKKCLKQLTEKENKPDLQVPKIIKQKPKAVKESKVQKPVEMPVQKAVSEPVLKPSDNPVQKNKLMPNQNPLDEQAQEATEDNFDFIEHLLETHALEEKAALQLLQIPKQITKIKARKRTCNGCGKTEEIDQVEKNTVIPVHAWFCEFCQQRAAKRLIRKGMTVHDYWGREFKVKKFINSDIVMGVLKNKKAKWEKRSFKIYGNWKTP